MTPAPDMDALIAEVEADATSPDPLDRLATAAAMAADLAGLADHLIGHYVDEARHAGASWADIGAEIGVTKQAAHQRHLARGRRHGRRDDAFDVPSGRLRLATDDFKRALQHAHEAAEDPRLRHGCVGTEHLLLGVLAVPESTGAQALANVGVTAEDVRARVERELGSGEGPPSTRRLTFSPRAKRVLHHAHRTARRERCRFLGTEHIVMAMADGEGVVGQCMATDILHELGATSGRVRDEVLHLWGRTGYPRD